MKTNIKKYASKTILLGASIAMLFGGFSSVSADAVIPLSSGIKNQFYSIEWCSPQYSRLSGSWSSPCRTGYFSNVGGVAKIVYDGQSFPTGTVTAQTNIASILTKTANTITSANVIDFFSSVTGGAFALEGEGVIKIKAFFVDYAENTSYYTITYKVDKTAPQLTFGNLNETTDFTYYGGRVNKSVTVYKNDSVNDSDSGDSYSNPLPSLYTGSTPASRLSHARPNLHAFYFQNTSSGLGANSPFTANVSYSDTYSSYLTPNATMSDGTSSALVAGERRFYLVPGAGSVMTADLWAPSTSVSMNTSQLIDNSLTNSQKYYRLRLYDDTVGSDGLASSGNYSETAFYVVRDNTKPNMGGNSLAGTDVVKASESLLKFSDNDTVYDTTTTAYDPNSAGYSRFFAANSNLALNYSISDKGITGDNTSAGAGCTDYALCNAGLDTNASTRPKINIDRASTPGSYDTLAETSARFENSGTRYKDFSKSDNGTLASNGTYRYYPTQFVTNGTPGQICDLVGNCINPNLNFRVVANAVESSQSKLTLSTNSDSLIGWAHKMLANGSDSYNFTYSLRDTYGNKVVPVQSLENSGTPVIKTIDTNATFANGLGSDQRSNTPTGTKLVVAADKESDNSPAVNASSINTSGVVAMREGTSNPNGNFGLTLASKVPTKGFYPYLSSNSVLKLQSIDAQGTGSASSAITYPKASADRLGYFSSTYFNAGNSSDVVTPNTGSIGETGGFSNITLDQNVYGQYAFTSSATNLSFLDMSNLNKRVNFEYASPIVYGLIGFKTLIDGQYMQHYKKIYNIGGLASGNYNVYERNLVAYDTDKDEQPGVLNFDIRQAGTTDNTLYNDGVRFTNGALGTFFPGTPIHKSFDILGATGSGYSAEVQMSAIAGHPAYDNSRLRTAFVSGLSYSMAGDVIRIPSVGRNIADASGGALDQYARSRAYYSDSYTIPSSATMLATAMISNIAVTGLTNQYNSITTDTSGTKANSNVSTEISRSDLTTTIKKNVAIQSAGFAGVNDSVPTGGKKWCSGTTINQSFIDNGPAECTQVIDGETITFVDGNSTLFCGVNTECRVSSKRSIIVQNGYLDIRSNVTTLDAAGSQTDGQLFLAALNIGGLSNLTIDGNNPDITNADKKGWMLIDPSVTNIDAFLVAQGPAVSYNGTNFFTKSLTTTNQLRNQLHVMGSLLTLNNIGGSRQAVPECPYIVNNCTEETAQMFDLIYLRRFTLQSKSIFTGNALDNNVLVPYHPDGYDVAKKSGGTTGDEPVIAASCTSNPTDLRCIKDGDYRAYPMLIERDTRWNDDPSVFFQMN